MRRTLTLAWLVAAACGPNENPTSDRTQSTDVLGPCDPAPLAQEGEVPFELREALTGVLDAERRRLDAPAINAVVGLPDGSVWVGASGVVSVEGDTPVDDTYAFRLGSITKSAVVATLLRLEAEGTLDLQATLDGWYPTLEGADSITLEQLARHTSGVRDYTSTAQFVQMLAAAGGGARTLTGETDLEPTDSTEPTDGPSPGGDVTVDDVIRWALADGLLFEPGTGLCLLEHELPPARARGGGGHGRALGRRPAPRGARAGRSRAHLARRLRRLACP